MPPVDRIEWDAPRLAAGSFTLPNVLDLSPNDGPLGTREKEKWKSYAKCSIHP